MATKEFTGRAEVKYILMLLMDRLGDDNLSTTLVNGGDGRFKKGTLTWSPASKGISDFEVELEYEDPRQEGEEDNKE